MIGCFFSSKNPALRRSLTQDMTDRIEPDPEVYADSSFETAESDYSTESLTASIYDYRYENGRRYHAYRAGVYPIPNDETEQDRLDIMHHINLLMLDGKLHIAPIGKNPQRILDIGTGTGIWAIDVGELYPSAQVIGTDLSPIQPSWVPPNVQFEIDDAESTWSWPENHFDFIHIRHMVGAIGDWPALFKQALKHIKPGGWVELVEYALDIFCDDDTLNKDMALSRYYELLHKASAATNSKFSGSGEMRPYIDAAGFENVTEKVIKMPLGTWPASKKDKEVGAYCLLASNTGFEAYGLALLTGGLGWTVEEVKELIDTAMKQAKDRRIHSYGKQFLYIGQKPEAK